MATKKEEIAGSFTLRITENAYQNIDDIAEFLANIQKQPLNAVKVVDAIFLMFNRITSNPYQFRECQELKTITKIYRIVSCKNWLIVYKIKRQQIIILGIIYGKRHPGKVKKLKQIK